jgi:uncharacterized protein
MFSPLPGDRFDRFHREFQGDTWDACTVCGGRCEINKIGSLMPGEAEYIASRLGQDIPEFRAAYLDGIQTPHGVVDVLKLKPGCPFLNASYQCTIKDVKVVLCEIYPVVFEVVNGQVEFSLDPWCPIVRHEPKIAGQFAQGGIQAIRRIGAPVEWYRAVSLYDGLCVDYDKLLARKANQPGYVILSLEAVLACQDVDSPPPVWSRPLATDG